MQEYLDRRKIRRATAVNFGLGASLDAWDALILAMTKKGYTKSELLEAGLAVQNRNGGLYDKFRNRLMLSCHRCAGRRGGLRRPGPGQV